MLKRVLTVAALGAVLLAGPALAQAPAPPAPPPAPMTHNDYTDPATWLCRPGRQDACTVDLDATVVRADGTTSIDRFKADPNAPVDCFYVYPTVSYDRAVNATMAIEPEEKTVVLHQLARFAARCRLYAPMYRQFTLTALAAFMTGHPLTGGDWAMPYQDVLDAWNEYLSHDNHGRGVILIGHSQGSGVLTQLIASEIDGKPVQKQIISAILMGTTLEVPPGKDVGGSFKTIPVCRASNQTGCVIAFASFRADSPPPANSRFGKGSPARGTVAACANPAALGGGSGALKSFFVAGASTIAGRAAAATAPVWTTPPTTITTPFVEVPGLLSAQCVSDERGTYLAITLHPTPDGKRTNQIMGDVVVGGVVQKDWGLHLIDADLNIGNLLDVVGTETKAWEARSSH